uniref:Dolichyl-diphosphooligosaccharide--protein glycosyltransferase subunit DAD1 n=1 Tax=Neolamprologus brichardi TaxID=32507 RepID=A0A3Q4HPL5_NEOBR
MLLIVNFILFIRLVSRVANRQVKNIIVPYSEKILRCRSLLYCLLVGTFPFNSFLSGFISCVGSFILAGKYFLSISPERAFADFLFAHTILHLVVMNFIG